MNGEEFVNTTFLHLSFNFFFFFLLPDKCHNIYVAFLEIYSFNLLLMWLKELLLRKKSVKMNAYYGMF